MPVPPARPDRLATRPFLGSAAIRDGLLTRQQLRGATWRRLFRDVYVSTRARDDHINRAMGAALLLQLADDRARLRAVQVAGWQVFHVTNADLRDLRHLMGELRAALDRRSRDLAEKGR